MSAPTASNSVDGRFRFGVFSFDATTLEMWKETRPVRVRPQSLKLLSLLLSRPGELISREEIQRALWGDETFVDYEQGVNHSIKELRAALGDVAESPRFIQTLPRRGYRFIAPVERIGERSGDRFGEPKPLPEAPADTVAGDVRPVATTLRPPTPRSRARIGAERLSLSPSSLPGSRSAGNGGSANDATGSPRGDLGPAIYHFRNQSGARRWSRQRHLQAARRPTTGVHTADERR